MLKSLSLIVLLTTGSSAMARLCPDLTGLFQMAEGSVIQYENDACARMIRQTGFTTKKGEIVMSADKQVIPLDGTPLCNNERCLTAHANSDSIQISLNYDNFVKTKDHGLCIQRSAELSIDGDNNFQTTYQVQSCDDGFSGTATKTFSRLM